MSGIVNDVAVIVPAHQAGATLGDCLAAIGRDGVPPDRTIVVDDGSRDATGDIAAQAGARVVRHGTPRRPARARNAGMALTDAAIVVFVDADVVVNRGAISRLLAAFDDPETGAAIGSYDDAPSAPRLVSRYRNLLHHHVHQTAGHEADTFWSGFGAVRRAAFDDAGPFDPAWENIEDVEFGLRLRAAGWRIALVPGAQATHAKDWTLGSMFRTDLWGRAVPWTRLLIAGRMPPSAMNGGARHRLAAAGVAAALLALPLAPFWPPALLVLLAGAALFLAANAAFWRRLARIGGARLVLGAIPAHAVHYVAALLGYGYARLRPVGEAGNAAGTGEDA